MVIMKSYNHNRNIHWITLLILYVFCSTAYAIDNPDSPDLVAEFQQRSKAHEKIINGPSLTNPDLISAYYEYQLFLDDELNKAYKKLRSELPKAQKNELKKSQQNWIKFRDAEFEFINNNWVRDNFGSSVYLSRGMYKSTIIQNRVLQLLYYAQNY